MIKRGIANKLAREDIASRMVMKKAGVGVCATCGQTAQLFNSDRCDPCMVAYILKRPSQSWPIPANWRVVEDPPDYPTLVSENPVGQVHVEIPWGEIWGIDETFEDDNPICRERFQAGQPETTAIRMRRIVKTMSGGKVNPSLYQKELARQKLKAQLDKWPTKIGPLIKSHESPEDIVYEYTRGDSWVHIYPTKNGKFDMMYKMPGIPVEYDSPVESGSMEEVIQTLIEMSPK